MIAEASPQRDPLQAASAGQPAPGASAPSSPSPGSLSTGSLRQKIVVGTACAGGAFLVFLDAGLIAFRDRTPPLTEQALRDAEQVWQQAGPRDYRLELTKLGNRTERVVVEVRDGEAVFFEINGYSPEQRRVWEYWTVPGMFGMLDEELDHARDPVAGYGAAAEAEVSLRADFDADHGFPRYFFRSVSGERLSVGWRVQRFIPLD